MVMVKVEGIQYRVGEEGKVMLPRQGHPPPAVLAQRNLENMGSALKLRIWNFRDTDVLDFMNIPFSELAVDWS